MQQEVTGGVSALASMFSRALSETEQGVRGAQPPGSLLSFLGYFIINLSSLKKTLILPTEYFLNN